MPEYTCLVPFLTDDPEFARGCEFGMFFCKLRHGGEKEYKEFLTIQNQDQILLAVSRMGWAVVEMKPGPEGWFWLHVREH